MSQIASAFAVPAGALAEAQRRLAAGDRKGFRTCLKPFEVGAGFPYSGSVVVVLAKYLRESGAGLPVSRDPAVRALVDHEDPLACANRAESAAAAAALARVAAPDAELARYWHDFTGDDKLDAGPAMRTALDWLRQAFAAGRESDWCLVLEG